VRIGVISDTHGLFDESIPSIFDGVDAIIQAGDIGKLEVIDRLEQIEPVFAVEGNNASAPVDSAIQPIIELFRRTDRMRDG
jgi:predicted phosphodiesterase